jgi:hypothetical protein
MCLLPATCPIVDPRCRLSIVASFPANETLLVDSLRYLDALSIAAGNSKCDDHIGLLPQRCRETPIWVQRLRQPVHSSMDDLECFTEEWRTAVPICVPPSPLLRLSLSLRRGLALGPVPASGSARSLVRSRFCDHRENSDPRMHQWDTLCQMSSLAHKPPREGSTCRVKKARQGRSPRSSTVDRADPDEHLASTSSAHF